MLGLAAGLGAACRPRAPAVLLGLAAGLFGAQHVPPTGPLGLLCLAAAAAYVELQRHEPALHLARVESIAS
jgi:hypothetical protein